MVRNRISQIIKYGYFKEALEALHEVNRLCREKGLSEATYWSPLVEPTTHSSSKLTTQVLRNMSDSPRRSIRMRT